MTDIFFRATEFRRMAMTFSWGSIADVSKVGVALRSAPNDIPDPGADAADLGEFTEVDTEGNDIVVKIGPWGGDVNPATGIHQVFVLIQTVGQEKIIKRPTTITVIGGA